ncbi:MAG: radical SAM protein, partial [Deltaproteobacteria bacterium]|nr:radical SAM protein [Deltaproteobacteria bacterium]
MSEDAQSDRASNWTRRLSAILKKVGLPVIDIMLTSRGLDVILEGDDGDRISVLVRDRDDDNAWFISERFAYSYRATAEPAEGDRGNIDLCRRVLVHLEDRFPKDWNMVASAGDDSLPQIFAERFPFATLERSRTDGSLNTEVLVRLNRECNLDCPFCSAPDLEQVDAGDLNACLEWVSENLEGARVALTGGEPTLRRDFDEVLRFVLGLSGIEAVQVQTNAVRFASSGWAASLPGPDPMLNYFVSMHAVDPDLYDLCTGGEGQFERAVKGTRALLAAGHRVVLNVVVNRHNLHHLDELVRSIPGVFGGDSPQDTLDSLPGLHFSTLTCPPGRPEVERWLVRYSELVPRVEAAAALAQGLGIEVDPLVGSTHAAVPPCLVGHEHRRAATHRPEPLYGETGYEDYRRPWVKASSCRRCRLDRYCLGVPAPYARQFGLGELKPDSGEDQQPGCLVMSVADFISGAPVMSGTRCVRVDLGRPIAGDQGWPVDEIMDACDRATRRGMEVELACRLVESTLRAVDGLTRLAARL